VVSEELLLLRLLRHVSALFSAYGAILQTQVPLARLGSRACGIKAEVAQSCLLRILIATPNITKPKTVSKPITMKAPVAILIRLRFSLIDLFHGML
jgi:hypothetical protein